MPQKKDILRQSTFLAATLLEQKLCLNNRFYPKIVKVHNQIKKMNDITDKLGRIRKYESMDYVAGIKIVDIEKASWSHESEEDG